MYSRCTISADLETTNDIEDCREWAVGWYDINTEEFILLKNLRELFVHCCAYEKCTLYFHNLKFDGGFIIDWLLNEGFTWTPDKPLPHEFTTSITDLNVFYSIKINIDGCVINILDSLKIINLSVAEIAKAFDLGDLTKTEIDYGKKRPKGYTPDEIETEYIRRDCAIVGKALKKLFSQNLNKTTQASNAFNNFKTTIAKNDFKHWFPTLDCDTFIRPGYRGGYTYLLPKYQNKTLGKCVVYDKNSMYPWVMRTKPMPYGKPVFFKGAPIPDKIYNCYIITFNCVFTLKEGYLPTIQDKHGGLFKPTEYLSSSKGQILKMTMTNIDFELFQKHYNIEHMEPLYGYKFMTKYGIFNDYIEYWYAVKEEADKSGNKAFRTIAKLMLNALYGKFGNRPELGTKQPILEDGKVRYIPSLTKKVKPNYLPIAMFITAYAREDLITAAQNNIDRIVYMDTDSLHLTGWEEPIGIELDNYKLGAWKRENLVYHARFIRAKRYMEHIKVEKNGKLYNKLDVKCAGMPRACAKQARFSNFKPYTIFNGKLQHKTVKGGVVLVETTFELKP